MLKLVSMLSLLAAFALPAQAASHAGGAPMPPASGAQPADGKAKEMKKDDKKAMKKEEKK